MKYVATFCGQKFTVTSNDAKSARDIAARKLSKILNINVKTSDIHISRRTLNS